MKKIYLLFAFSTIYFFGCTSNTETTSDSTKTNTSQTVNNDYVVPDSSGLFLIFLNPKEKVNPIPTIEVGKALVREDTNYEKLKLKNIDFTKRNFEVNVETLIKFIDSIPNEGFFGVTFGVKSISNKYKDLNLGLLSFDKNYTIQKENLISINNFVISDTATFKKMKEFLYENGKGMTEYNPDKKYQHITFKKIESADFFKKFKPSFKDGKVYINMIYDKKTTSIGFPNVLFSNVKDLNKDTKIEKLRVDEDFVFGNEGQSCCPPQQ